MPPLISLSCVSKSYTQGELKIPALREIELDIHSGEFIAIVGASGSGKSTLMNIIGLLDPPSGGVYSLLGADISTLGADELAAARRDGFGFIFQQYHLMPKLTALANVEVPSVYAGAPAEYRRRRAAALLNYLGLGDRCSSFPVELSGGQQQRVAIARALMNGGKVILADEPTGALDRKSGLQVLELLRDLSDLGHTVILVTHDEQVAAAAERRIEIEAGQIVRDTGRSLKRKREGNPLSISLGESGGEMTWFAMWKEAGRAALLSIAANPFRTILTLLGIIFGVAAVIAMLSIGRGTQMKMIEEATSLGSNWIVIARSSNSATASSPLTEDDVSVIKTIRNIEGAIPRFYDQASVRFENAAVSTGILGTNTDFPIVNKWDVSSGSFFTKEDEIAGAPIAVLGNTVATKLFGSSDPLGQNVLINNTSFLVAGVLIAKGSDESGQNRDDIVVVPYRAAKSRIFGDQSLSLVVASIKNMALLDQTRSEIKTVLTERHGREDFSMYDVASAFQRANASRESMNLLLAAVASISILVGGVGVMNMMLMTVKERTKEIGIRLAVGARAKDILGQFLTEAMLLSTLGGVIGIAFGISLAVGAALLLKLTVALSFITSVCALIVSIAIGLIFGIAPALRASRSNPITALHT
jgi:macrolide transport system ATP-binding/permease protein